MTSCSICYCFDYCVHLYVHVIYSTCSDRLVLHLAVKYYCIIMSLHFYMYALNCKYATIHVIHYVCVSAPARLSRARQLGFTVGRRLCGGNSKQRW